MLNPFPIQFLALFAYFILRVFVAIVLLRIARSQYTSYRPAPISNKLKVVIAGEVLLSGLFLIGMHTQYAAMVLAVLSVYALYNSTNHSFSLHIPTTTALLLLAISLSLFITSAGVFAVDLPI